MPGAQCTRSLACAGVVSMHASIHSGGTGNIRHSPRDGFTVFFALSPVTSSFLPPSPHRLTAHLTPGWAD
jgi:hypothetical protein